MPAIRVLTLALATMASLAAGSIVPTDAHAGPREHRSQGLGWDKPHVPAQRFVQPRFVQPRFVQPRFVQPQFVPPHVAAHRERERQREAAQWRHNHSPHHWRR